MRRALIYVCLFFACIQFAPGQNANNPRASTQTSNSQPEQFYGKRILSIQYSPAQVLDPADLARAVAVKVGEPLRAEDIADSLDGLFATGHFEDLSAEAEPSGEGVTVRFVMKAAHFIGGVAVEGKILNPPNRGEISSASQLQLGNAFHQEDLDQAVSQIQGLFTSNGLYEAEVIPELKNDDLNQQIFVTFLVKPAKRAKYEAPVIQGDTKLADSTIIRATGWRIPVIHWWRQVTASRTRKGVLGIASKYQSQKRLTAKVELETLDYDAQSRRVTPQLNIVAGPKVEVKALEAKVSQRTLKKFVPVFEERAVDNDLLVEGARNLRSYFQNKGYYDVTVDFRQLPVANDLETVEYVISQGQRYKLARVTITGNKYFDAETVRERMFLQPANLTMRHGRYSETFRSKDQENIENLYKANGFADVKVTSVVDHAYQGKNDRLAVTIQVAEGPQWMVDNLTVTGVTKLDADNLKSEFASLAGQPFSLVNMASDRNHTLTLYYGLGFPDADFKAAWVPGALPHHVNISYTVTEGEQQFVRKVLTSGVKATRERLIDHRITLHPGDPLSPIEQTTIQKRFYDMGVFARVDTAIQNRDGNTQHKDILYNFEEANRYTVSVGVGAQIARFGKPSNSDLSSAGGTTGFSPQFSLNANRLNVWGIGHSVSFRGVYSSLQKRASISYFAPRFQDIEGRSVTASLLYDDSLDVRTFASRREEASVQLSQRFSRGTTGLFRFAYRRVAVSSVVIPVLLVPQILQPVRLGILSANIARDRRDNSADAHHGSYTTGDLGVSTKYFGSQRSFARVLMRNATYYSITRSIVFARQTQFGVIFPFEAPNGLTDAESVPLPERFFGGGADSIRAFPYNQAGPRDTGTALIPGGPVSAPTGFPLGGNALLFNNLELRFPLLGANIQGVVFHDMGNVYNRLQDISFRAHQSDLKDFNYMVHAVGFGVRYRTPIGPVRGDLAYSINPPSYLGFSGTPTQILQCNPNALPGTLPSYCTSTQNRVSHFQFFFSIGQTF